MMDIWDGKEDEGTSCQCNLRRATYKLQQSEEIFFDLFCIMTQIVFVWCIENKCLSNQSESESNQNQMMNSWL